MDDMFDDRFEDPRTALKRHGLVPKHSWGQNFLVSERAVANIAGACKAVAPPLVIEIGAGLGTLTAGLLRRGMKVICVERDRDMCAVLRTDFATYPGFTLLEADAAKVDYRSLLKEHKGVIAGNLPYQLTGRLLRTAVETSDRLLRGVFMVQEEVAERLVALPRTSSRGSLSVVVQARFDVKVILRLKPTAFHPPPKVRSAVLSFDPVVDSIFAKDLSPTLFDAVVNAAFCSRRKTIRNSLSASSLDLSVVFVENLLDKAAVDPRLRPEELTVHDFARLARKAQESGALAGR